MVEYNVTAQVKFSTRVDILHTWGEIVSKEEVLGFLEMLKESIKKDTLSWCDISVLRTDSPEQ